ncbi:NUDIX domain-containing protein [Halobacillus locisalis]|uniref:NUDIX domain-containing protein n=2 Tax=Halobacillus locisalis TaxID=220753 RepID=A0A838CRU0_9BACI|nr:NUDIX domain-containing protein [Halobacillus locisalis]
MIHREAVRAVILSKEKILLVQSSKRDYKFPGGGIEEKESHSEALLREIKEETGYIHGSVKEKIGIIVERKLDEYEKGKVFQMTSHYYLCELTNQEAVAQQLDPYETELAFMPEWVSLEEAIRQNERLIKQGEQNSWLKRETFVLNEINTLVVKCKCLTPHFAKVLT